MEKTHFAILTFPYSYAHFVHWTIRTSGKLSVLGRIVAPKDAHVSIPGNSEQVTFQGKWSFADVMIRVLRWQISLDYLGEPCVIAGVPTSAKGRQEGRVSD